MAKPEEVLVVVDENGNAVEELVCDSETVALYNTQKECLCQITQIDSRMVYQIMTWNLDHLKSNEESFSFDKLNKLCWALGSINGVMVMEEESRFVVIIIKELLNLVEKKKGKNNKAQVASDIMHIVG